MVLVVSRKGILPEGFSITSIGTRGLALFRDEGIPGIAGNVLLLLSAPAPQHKRKRGLCVPDLHRPLPRPAREAEGARTRVATEGRHPLG